MTGVKASPLVVKRFEPRMVKAIYGDCRVYTCGRSKCGYVGLEVPQFGRLTPTAARKLAEAIHDAADFLDGGVQVTPSNAKCRCGSKKGLKMVQERDGHWRAQLRWGPPKPVCPKCRKKDRGTFRYCPTKWGC